MIVYDPACFWPKALGFPSNSQPLELLSTCQNFGWSWLFTQNSGSAILSQSWPLSAKKARHPILCTLAEITGFGWKWLNLGENGWIWPFSANFSHAQPDSAIFSHFQPKFSHFGWKWLKMSEFWLKMAENGWIFLAENGWKWLNFGWKWLKMAENGWKWLNFWILAEPKFRHFQPFSAIFSQNSAIFSHFQPKFRHFQPFSAILAENGSENGWIWKCWKCHFQPKFSHFQPFSAKIQTFSAKFSHFQPKFSHFQPFCRLAEFWLKRASGWNSAKFWPELWKWLTLVEKGLIFGRLKGGRFCWKWCSCLERARKTQPTPIKKNSHSQPNPFLAWWLYLSRG